ncbi:hypothetical protein [Spirosoma rigui]|uniref:hypothetical protein n=1 Tax=Spirosoma rigui TaxID=564064 RepID=UPI0009B00B23|nr:hypothetical protein [Spirosoma rigui]
MDNQHTSPSESPATALIDETIRAFDQGQAASPQEGMSLIANWFSSLENETVAGDVMEPLTQLRNELQGGAPDASRLQQLLTELADKTDQVADKGEGDVSSRLTTLSTALRNFAGQLSTAV